MTDSESDQSFLGMVLATPFDLKREQTRAVTRSWAGHVDEALRPDGVMAILSNVWPDALGKRNLAGKVRAHLAKYGTAIPFEEVCPQHLNTLSGDGDVIVRDNAAIGATEVMVLPDDVVIREGRVVSFGEASKRLYQVADLGQSNTVSHLEIGFFPGQSVAEDAPAGAPVTFNSYVSGITTPATTLFRPAQRGDTKIALTRKTRLRLFTQGDGHWHVSINGQPTLESHSQRQVKKMLMTLDYPLVAAVSANDAVNTSPTGRWLWTLDSVNNPPDWSRGIVAGIGFLLDVVEAV